jgi:endonuclease/exonuclease/phosphatase family metal-dependent hydrolase
MCRETHMQHSNGMREGLAILSSLELGNTQILLLPSSQPARRMIETEVTVHDHLIRLRNFHATYAPSAARQAQIEAALTPSEGSLIVGGDFNIRPHQLELLLAGRLCDPQAGSQACTWPLDWEQLSIAWERKLGVPPHFSFDPSRIDYLLVKEVAVQESGVLALGSPGHWASDHALIWLDLEPDLKTLQNVCSDRLVYTRASRDSPLTCLAQP